MHVILLIDYTKYPFIFAYYQYAFAQSVNRKKQNRSFFQTYWWQKYGYLLANNLEKGCLFVKIVNYLSRDISGLDIL